MTTPRPASELLDLLERFRGRLDAQDRATLKTLIDSYTATYKRLEPRIVALADEIAGLIEKGEPVTYGKLYRLRRYVALEEQIADEIGAYSGALRTLVNPTALQAMGQATKDTKAIIALFGADARGLAFERLPQEALQVMLGFLDPASPLYQRIQGYAPYTVDKIRQTLLDGITLGMNPRRVASMLAGNAQRTLGLTLTDALRTARTVQIWAYREATRANYVANQDVVTGWVWWAKLDGFTCLSCVANHGKEFPLDVELDDHYNGRCTMIPMVYGINPVNNAETGQQWFERQGEALQREMMGAGKFDAWQAGKFDFSKLSVERPDEVYGRMKFEASLRELIGNE